MHSRMGRILAIGTGAGAFILAGVLVWGQTPPPTTQPQTTPAPPNQPSTGQDAAAPASTASQPQKTLEMVQAQASLDHGLDAKKARQGEPVTAKLAKNVQIPNAQELPRNTILEGHVDEVKPSEHKSDSVLVVTFDKAKLKNGQELPIKATVLAVAEPALLQQEQANGTAPGTSSAPLPAPSAQGGGMGPGGSQRAAPSEPMDVPEASSPSQRQSQKNGVPGVTLQSDIHDSTSATFTSKGRNVDVPGGTQMELAIAVIPAGTRIQ